MTKCIYQLIFPPRLLWLCSLLLWEVSAHNAGDLLTTTDYTIVNEALGDVLHADGEVDVGRSVSMVFFISNKTSYPKIGKSRSRDTENSTISKFDWCIIPSLRTISKTNLADLIDYWTKYIPRGACQWYCTDLLRLGNTSIESMGCIDNLTLTAVQLNHRWS